MWVLGDLCGDEVDCRVWTYKGKEYDITKAMIIWCHSSYVGDTNIVLEDKKSKEAYQLPENLRRFFDSI